MVGCTCNMSTKCHTLVSFLFLPPSPSSHPIFRLHSFHTNCVKRLPKTQTLTNRGQYFHGPHGGLDVEPELLQGQEALPLEVLQLSDQDQVLLHQGPHGCRQRVVHLTVLKGRLFLNKARGQTPHNRGLDFSLRFHDWR